MALRLIAAALVVLAAGCPAPGREAVPSPTSPPDELPPPRSVVPASPDTDLDLLLIDEAPDGYEVAHPEEFQVGPIDLEAAVSSETDPDAERALLTTRGFERGYAKAWTHPRGDTLVVTVYRFTSSGGASAYMSDGLESALGRGAEEFPVPDVRGARGFSRVEEDDAGAFTTFAVVFVRGPLFFLLVHGSEEPGRTPGTVRAVAERQDNEQGAGA